MSYVCIFQVVRAVAARFSVVDPLLCRCVRQLAAVLRALVASRYLASTGAHRAPHHTSTLARA
jgi:hypothetical protein